MTYLYRDGGNYKHWQEVVLPNKSGKSATELAAEIKNRLISGQFFEQDLAPLPFEYPNSYDPELDNTWLEFDCFEEVTESPQVVEDVTDFIAKLI